MFRLRPLLLSILLATGATLAQAGLMDDVTAGVKAQQRGDGNEALRQFTKALSSSEFRDLPANDQALLYVLRGNVWYSGNAYDKAIADFDEAVKVNPRMSEAFNNRANAWYKKGDFDRAIADFNEAVRIKPTADAYRNRGDSWQMKKDYERAIADYDQALKLNPQDATARENRDGAVSRRGSGAQTAQSGGGGGGGNSNCKGNDQVAANLRALGATGIQIEGCVDAKPAAQGTQTAQASGLQLPPPDMSKPMPFAESPGHLTNGITAQVVGNFVKSAQDFYAGALLGDPGCAFNLAIQYEYGQGVPKDRKLANAWLEKAIEDQRMLEQRALRYNFTGFLDLAKRGYAPAQFAAGVAYAEGNDGQKPTGSMEQARLWLNRAVAQGYSKASATLADIDRPPPSPSSNVAFKYEEPDYMKRAAAARKAQNAANCERHSKGAMVFCAR